MKFASPERIKVTDFILTLRRIQQGVDAECKKTVQANINHHYNVLLEIDRKNR